MKYVGEFTNASAKICIRRQVYRVFSLILPENTEVMPTSPSLRFDFIPVTKDQWLDKIRKDLDGKPLEALEWQLDGLRISPFTHSEDVKELPPPTSSSADWEIGEDIVAHDLLEANRQVRQALGQGVQAPRFILDENLGDHRMATLLEGITLPFVSIHFYEKNKNANPRHLLEHFYHIARETCDEAGKLRGSVNWAFEDAVVVQDALELVEFAQHKLPGFKVIPVNSHPWFKEGEPVMELAQLAGRAIRWMDGLEEKGLPAVETNRFLQFSVSVGKNYFIEIAKLRALRLLWANVMKAYRAISFEMPPVEAHTAASTQQTDPNTNMIQATTQAMAAVIGGASRLTVLPSDAFTGQTTEFSRRIARNVQHILKMESHFDWVADPAAGSYFVEKLSGKLAAAAWEKMKELV